MTVEEAAGLLGVILRDRRVRVIEMSEHAALRDVDRRSADTLVGLLAGALGR
jgi:hypothetical protein